MSTVAPFVAVSTTVRPNRRPPRPKHPKFTQFHRSGLHFGRIHPQHRQYGDSSKAYGDCHSVRGRRSLARHRKRRTEPHVNNLLHRHGGHRRTRMAWLRCRWAVARPARQRTNTDHPSAHRPHRCGERRRVRRARVAGSDGTWNTSETRLRCPWAAAGPGRTTRRATLAARTARGRAAAHGHRHTKQPDPASGRAAAHGHRHTKQPGSASGRADPHQSPRPHRCGGHRRDRRARAGFEARHRAKRGRLASRAAGPSSARNTRGA